MKKISDRRGFMAGAAAFFALPWLTLRRAHAQSDAVDAIIQKITGGAAVQPGSNPW